MCNVDIGGVYQHYKGNKYKVLAIARHSETCELMVVYQALYGEAEIWVRPYDMFVEKINGVERFKLLDCKNG